MSRSTQIGVADTYLQSVTDSVVTPNLFILNSLAST